VPLRFPRPVVPVIAVGMSAVWVMAGSAPAFADQIRQQEWWLGALNVSQAWQASRGGGVTVAVLSDGVDAAQADLGHAVTVGPDYTSTAETSTKFTGLQGTAIASLIAGRGHGTGDDSGVIGVAPKARILSVRVTLDPADTALDSAAVGAGLPGAIANGIRYAVAHHAKVIDLPTDPGEPDPALVAALPIPTFPVKMTQAPQVTGITAAAGGSSAEKSAVAYAEHKGVVLVAPAGDNGAGTDAVNYPAAYPGVIAVGGFGQNFASSASSGHQSYVALTAPGADVTAADSTGGYTSVTSTNAASALVSGIAALIRSRYPSLSAAQVAHTLIKTTVYRPTAAAASGLGTGTVDAGRALAAAAALAAPADARAGAGAAPLVQPPAPGITPVASDGLAPRILRAAIISAGVLILLILLILGYKAAGRRRGRKHKAASAEWARSTQNAYSAYGAKEADQMLEFFAAPSTDPRAPAEPFPQFPAAQPPGAQAAASGSVATATATATARGGAAGATNGAPAGGETGAWVPLGPASRAPSRQPRVSGAPPWEPAYEPDSELPWASVPGPATATAPSAAAGASAARPAVSATAASDSIWPSVTSAPATSAPAGGSWADLAASSPAAESAPARMSALATNGLPSAPASAARSGSHARHAAPAASAAPDAMSAPPDAMSAPPDAPDATSALAGATSAPADAATSTGGSRWDFPVTPRSPSGSAWELPDSEPEDQAAPDDLQWQHADSDAYRQPAPAQEQWQPASGGASWPSTADVEAQWLPPAAAEAASGSSGSHRMPTADSAQWPPAEEQRQPADEQWQSADTGSQWQPAANDSYPGGDAPWQPAAAPETPWTPPAEESSRWKASGQDSQWQPPAAEPKRQATTGSAPWESSTVEPVSWEPAASDTRVGEAPASESPVSDTQASDTQAGDTRWEPAIAESAWRQSSGSGWESAGTQSRWDAVVSESEPTADEDQVFAWRPSDQTESFPAIGED
jgi:subtilisin family serine protease